MDMGRLRDARMYCERHLAIANTRANVETLEARLEAIEGMSGPR